MERTGRDRPFVTCRVATVASTVELRSDEKITTNDRLGEIGKIDGVPIRRKGDGTPSVVSTQTDSGRQPLGWICRAINSCRI
jgi:hypothetical protein